MKNKTRVIKNPLIGARVFYNYALEHWSPSDSHTVDERREFKTKLCFMDDTYLKAKSFSTCNKIAFSFGLLTGLVAVFWPIILLIMKSFGIELQNIDSSMIQTTTTALSIASFSIYLHYKKKQNTVEKMMRLVVYLDESLENLSIHFITTFEQMDAGFDFRSLFQTISSIKNEQSSFEKRLKQ
ncbi:MAG: hypothetical protein KKI09_05330 [Spirochaetes bacterium]|nr:hypothetical protein [Spirochaetota bacterium]